MASKPLLVLFVLLLGAACGVGLVFALDANKQADGTDAVTRPGADEPDPEGLHTEPAPGATEDGAHLVGSERAAARAAEVLAENERLKAVAKDLETQVAELEPDASETDPEAFRFGVTASALSFGKADWKDLSGHMLELSKVLTDIRDEVLAGGQPSAKSMKGIQKHNTPLAMFALGFGAEMGEEAHIAYTHPAVIANLIRSALTEAQDPLTRGQEIAIKTLGDAWEREVQKKGAIVSPTALGKMVVEVEGKLRFLDDVKAVLTPSQRAVLFDPETEGRSQLDLLSPAWVFAMRRPLAFPDRTKMELGLVEALFGLAEIEVEDPAPFLWVGRPWVDDVPGALMPKASRSLDMVFPRVDDLLVVARAEVRAIERLTGAGQLSDEQKTAMQGVTWLLHPHIETAAPAAPDSD